MEAIWNNQLLAESDKTITLEGNVYFAADSVKKSYLEPSSHTTTCPIKGIAHYYHIVVEGKTNNNAAWYYPEPKEAAKHIKNFVAFWKGVQVTEK